jgi:arsenate reductase (thioredoxin)
MTDPAQRPTVLFVCVHNAGRSQMAAGFLTELAGGRVDVRSAGSLPADQVNPVAVGAMAEVGIDIAGQQPKILTTDAVRAADVVITMGCGDTCPVFPGQTLRRLGPTRPRRPTDRGRTADPRPDPGTGPAAGLRTPKRQALERLNLRRRN